MPSRRPCCRGWLRTPRRSSGRSAPRRRCDLVVAATTDIHGRVRGWNYDVESPRPGGGPRARRDDRRLAAAARRPGASCCVDAGDLLQGNPLDVRRGARVADSSAAPGHRRDERDAVRRGGGRQSRVQLRRSVPRADDRARRSSRSSPRTRRAPTARRAFRAGRSSSAAGVKVGIVGATTPGSMVWDRDNLARPPRHRATSCRRCATAVAEARAAGADVVVVTMHCGLDEPATLRHRRHRTAERERGGARRARGARHRPDRLRPLAQGDGRHDDQRRAPHAGEELGDERRRRAPRGSRATAATLARRRAKSSTRSCSTARPRRRARRARRDGAGASRRRRVGHDADRTTPTWPGAPTRRASSTRRCIDFILEVERRAAARRSRVDRGVLARRVDRLGRRSPRRACRRSIRTTTRCAPFASAAAAPRLPRAERALLSRPTRRARRRSTRRFPASTSTSSPAPTTCSTSRARRPARHAARGERPRGRADGQLHPGAEQLSPDGRRRLRDARRRAVVYDKQQEIRQLLIDEVRRAGTLAPAGLLHAQLAHRAGERRGVAVSRRCAATRGGRSPRARHVPHAAATSRAARARRRGPRRGCASSARTTSTARSSRAPTPGASVAAARRIWPRRSVAREAECAAPQCETLLVDGGDEFQGTPASNLAFGRPVVAHLQRARLRGGRARQPRVRLGAGHPARAHARRALRLPRRQRPVRRRSRRPVDPRRHADRARARSRSASSVSRRVLTADARRVARTWPTSRFLPTRRRSSTASRVGCARAARTTSSCSTTTARSAIGRRRQPAAARSSASRSRSASRSTRSSAVTRTRSSTRRSPAFRSCRRIPAARRSMSSISGRTASRISVRDVLTDSIAPRSRGRATRARRRWPASRRSSNQPIATIAQTLTRPTRAPQYPLGNLIADAMRAAGQGDVAVMNNGGIRRDLRAGTGHVRLAVRDPAVRQHALPHHRHRRGAARLPRAARRARPADDPRERRDDRPTILPRRAGARLAQRHARRRHGDRCRRASTALILNDFMADGRDGLGLSDGRDQERASRPPSTSTHWSTYLQKLPQPVQRADRAAHPSSGTLAMTDTVRVFVNGDGIRRARRRHGARRRRRSTRYG